MRKQIRYESVSAVMKVVVPVRTRVCLQTVRTRVCLQTVRTRVCLQTVRTRVCLQTVHFAP
jgi:hypothetical protein